MKIEILSQNQKIYEGITQEITLPGVKGQFQVLPNHAPLFALLGEGQIIIGKNKKIPVCSGVVEVLNNHITILVKQPVKNFAKNSFLKKKMADDS